MNDSQTIKHARVTTTIAQADGSTSIKTEGYYEELNSVKQEIQQSVKTSKATFVADLMHSVSPISDGVSREVTLKIEANDQHEPTRIIKTWTIKKEYYGR